MKQLKWGRLTSKSSWPLKSIQNGSEIQLKERLHFSSPAPHSDPALRSEFRSCLANGIESTDTGKFGDHFALKQNVIMDLSHEHECSP